VLNCIDSYDYVYAMRQQQYGASLTDIDRFLLFTCWEYMPVVVLPSQSSTNSLYKIDSIYNIYDELLTRFEYALDQSSSITSS
ncbi:unnamed protein product, partial [Rotaria sordida]